MNNHKDLAEKFRKSARNTLRRAMSFVSGHLTSTKRVENRREHYEAHRKKKGLAHVVTYFHDVTDPYSHLAAQALTHLKSTYEIELRVMLVSPPVDEVVPERDLHDAFAIKDARDVAPWQRAEFDPGPVRPSVAEFAKAGRLLSAALARSTFCEDAPGIGAALWATDTRDLSLLASQMPAADETLNARHQAEGDRERERQGHYLGAVFTYGEECYQGIDRLYHLEERLVSLGVRNAWAAPKMIFPRRAESEEAFAGKAGNIKVELFASLADPCSYIVMERTFRLVRRYGLDFEFRPILPMVAVDLPAPRIKRHYITFDATREAKAAGIDFGRIQKPDGEPLERVYSLYPWARERGLGNDLLLSFAEGVFAEGLDGGTDEGLRTIVERTGLDWNEALTHLGNDRWRLEFEGNRVDLMTSGLWDTPTFKVIGGGAEDFVSHGQDRLWLVEEEIIRRAGNRQALGLLAGQHVA